YPGQCSSIGNNITTRGGSRVASGAAKWPPSALWGAASSLGFGEKFLVWYRVPMSSLGDRVRKGPLILKGEKPKKKKKSKHHHHHTEDDGLIISDGNVEEQEPAEVPVRKCTGRIVCTNSTIQGMNTKFMDEIEQGDTILVHHPQSLQIEERQVVSVLS
ncbi:hypothetical protein FOZ63_012223, partial [Perkinsus olseni]